jgi:hypothetical protein
VLGPAAQWLAARHPRWLAAAPGGEPSEARWKEGSTAERVAELQAVRRVDRARAREWLRATWEQDPPEAREAFLRALLPTVAPDDEEFLEMALDDKRKGARRAAFECLVRLPGSAHARRNLERLGSALRLEETGGLLGRLRKRTLTVELPAALDKTAQRDGIEAKVPAGGAIGERAYWLMQMVAAVPPRHWCERFGCDAQSFLAAVLDSDEAGVLPHWLTTAAVRHPDPEWALVLARHWLSKDDIVALTLETLKSLAESLPVDDRATFVETLVAESKRDQFSLVSMLLDSLDFQWSSALTSAAFYRLVAIVANDRGTGSQNRNRLEAWARCCDIRTGGPRIAALLEQCGEGHGWRNALERFNDIVAFRAAMQEELRP